MIGFIGAGNMASAIIRGLVSGKKYKGEDIAVYDLCKEKAEELKCELFVNVMESETEIVNNCDTVVLAVKPNVFPSLLEKIGNGLKEKDPLIISIAAGKTTDNITVKAP